MLGKTRCVIEHTFGHWKGRFRCLQKKLEFNPQKCTSIIMVTACLHTYATERGDIYFEKGFAHIIGNDIEDRPAEYYDRSDVQYMFTGRQGHDRIAHNNFL